MYCVKTVEQSSPVKVLYQSTWLIANTVRFQELTICERAVLKAPEGKVLTLTVDGVGCPIAPGTYRGDVVLTVSEPYAMGPGGLMRLNRITRDFQCAAVIEDGVLREAKCVPELLHGGSIDGACAQGLTIASTAESYNGIVVAGKSKYTVKDVKVDFEGFGDNDFLGVGAAVTAVDDAEVLIEDCNFTFSGVTRCAVHSAGHSSVHVKNCKIQNISPDSDWLGDFSWQIDLRGTNRLMQLADCANVVYENCDLKTNGWGICSIDGTDESIKMHIKDCRLELSGPRSHGYGAFCIGENEVVFENSRIDVNGYPLLMMGMEGLGHAVMDGCRVKGNRFGVAIFGDDDSVLDIKNTDFKTDKSTICIKGSATVINVENSTMKPGNGTILQLMDTEESGMDVSKYFVPVGVEDVALEDRDVTAVSPTEDVTLNITGCDLTGSFYNSTTNIRAYKNSLMGGRGAFHDTVVGVMEPPPGGKMPEFVPPLIIRHHGDDLRGPKNLGLNLVDTKVTGVISSATQAYRPGVRTIDADNRAELSNVTQTAAPTVNNGVVVSLDEDSEWTVTGTSYITGLVLAPGAQIRGAEGKAVSMTVDGAPTELAPGTYSGKIVITVA